MTIKAKINWSLRNFENNLKLLTKVRKKLELKKIIEVL